MLVGSPPKEEYYKFINEIGLSKFSFEKDQFINVKEEAFKKMIIYYLNKIADYEI